VADADRVDSERREPVDDGLTDGSEPDHPEGVVAEFTAREGYLTKGELVAWCEDAVRNFRKRGYRS